MGEGGTREGCKPVNTPPHTNLCRHSATRPQLALIIVRHQKRRRSTFYGFHRFTGRKTQTIQEQNGGVVVWGGRAVYVRDAMKLTKIGILQSIQRNFQFQRISANDFFNIWSRVSSVRVWTGIKADLVTVG